MEVKISPESYIPSEKLGAELVDHIAENGKVIPCVQKGLVKVAIDKANIYCMGKVPMYPQEELQQLQRLKQSNRKQFDADKENEKNYEEAKYYDKTKELLVITCSRDNIGSCSGMIRYNNQLFSKNEENYSREESEENKYNGKRSDDNCINGSELLVEVNLIIQVVITCIYIHCMVI